MGEKKHNKILNFHTLKRDWRLFNNFFLYFPPRFSSYFILWDFFIDLLEIQLKWEFCGWKFLFFSWFCDFFMDFDRFELANVINYLNGPKPIESGGLHHWKFKTPISQWTRVPFKKLTTFQIQIQISKLQLATPNCTQKKSK